MWVYAPHMHATSSLEQTLQRLEARLGEIDKKIDALSRTKTKSLEWIGTLSEQIQSLDDFREEVRQSFEPVLSKLSGMDEVVRILRHATSDVSRKMEQLERRQQILARSAG